MENSNIDDKDFDSKDHFNNLLKTKNLKQLVELNLLLQSQIKSYDHDIQNLVFENYSKFITSIDTVKNMRESIENLEEKFGVLKKSVNNINVLANKIENCLEPKRKEIKNLNKVNQDLSNLKMLYEFPTIIKEDLLKFKENFNNIQELEKNKNNISKLLTFFPQKTIQYYKIIENKLENLKNEELIKPIYADSKAFLKEVSNILNLIFFSKIIKLKDFVKIYQILIQIDNDKNRLTRSFFNIYNENLIIKLRNIFINHDNNYEFLQIDSKYENNKDLENIIKKKLLIKNKFTEKIQKIFDNLNFQFNWINDESITKNINKDEILKNNFETTKINLIIKIEKIIYEELFKIKNGFYLFSFISNKLINFSQKFNNTFNKEEFYLKYINCFKIFGISYFIKEFSNLVSNNENIFQSKIDITLKEKLNPLIKIFNERLIYLNEIFNFMYNIFSDNLDFNLNKEELYNEIYFNGVLCVLKGKNNLPINYNYLLVYNSFDLLNNEIEILISLIFLYRFIIKFENLTDDFKINFYKSIFTTSLNIFQKLIRNNMNNFIIDNNEKNLNQIFEIYKIIKSSLFFSNIINDSNKNIISKDFIFNNKNNESNRILSKQIKLNDNEINENNFLSSLMRIFLRILLDILRKNVVKNFFELSINLIQLIYDISDKYEENIVIGFAFEMYENNKLINNDYEPTIKEIEDFKTKYNII